MEVLPLPTTQARRVISIATRPLRYPRNRRWAMRPSCRRAAPGRRPVIHIQYRSHNSFGGFPSLNEDITWKDDVPLFVTGRPVALQLGPAELNIGGARTSAERIALAVHQILESQSEAGGLSAKRYYLVEEDIVHGEGRDSGVRFLLLCLWHRKQV